MQLPDHLFGRRFLISCSSSKTGAPGFTWDVSEIAFPEVCVIWELMINVTGPVEELVILNLALINGAANAISIAAGEPLFNGLGVQGAGPREIIFAPNSGLALRNLRLPVRTAGRRMGIQMERKGAGPSTVIVGVVVSAIPKDIPDCLL